MLNVVELYLIMVCKYSHAQGVMLVWTCKPVLPQLPFSYF